MENEKTALAAAMATVNIEPENISPMMVSLWIRNETPARR